MRTDFELQFAPESLSDLASRDYDRREDLIVNVIEPRATAAGNFDKQDFLELVKWKSPRNRARCVDTDERFVQEVTQIALSTSSEKLRIEADTLLRGVGWPTAPVILHFAHPAPYPILDFRAFESLGVTAVADEYGFDSRWTYTQGTRDRAAQCGIGMRDLDRALWQFSKEKSNEN
jgi:hypothetical protein